MKTALGVFCALLLLGGVAGAETLRIATYNSDLTRKGPGLLLRDILKGEDAQIAAVQEVIKAVAPDILVLQGIDYDYGLSALSALRDALSNGRVDYPYIFALRPNAGMATGLDMDGDGRKGGARDGQGYGQFAGEGGMAILSRLPIDTAAARDFSAMLWKDIPGALLPEIEGKPFPSAQAQAVQRLSSVAHLVVPIELEQGRSLDLLTFHATPPVFDGPEDLNGRRNHDEILFWLHYLNGEFGPAPDRDFVVIGDANLDPVDGEGRKQAILDLLNDPRVQDPKPMRPGVVENTNGDKGDPKLDTVDWPLPDPGPRRVDYILPSADLKVVGSGVYWPEKGSKAAAVAAAASRHRMVWVDLEFQ